jgi:lysophospholipid acyltransferase (LPLAT)-like uncharacterized protein
MIAEPHASDPARGERAPERAGGEGGSGEGWLPPARDLRPGLRYRLIGLLGAAFVRAWGATLRIEWLNPENLEAIRRHDGRVCYAIWHGALLPLAYTHRGRGIVILVSRHRDGEIISQIICRLGFGVVRGSTNREGLRALLGMAKEGRSGRPLGVTPDGPRGPRRELQAGVLLIAQRSGLPIVPVAVEAVRRRELSSWDRFQIPCPWTRVVVVTGPPIHLPERLDPSRLEPDWGPRISAALDAAQAQADAWRDARVGPR